MTDTSNDKHPIIYRKLVRDRIPEIIKEHGKTPVFRTIQDAELQEALAQKILEEAYELHSEWKRGDREGVLKESADTLEILLALLSKFGLSLDDLITMQKKRREARGGFDCGSGSIIPPKSPSIRSRND